MKKGKGKAKKARVVVAEKYEKDEGSSEDEMPEVVSNAAMKSNHEALKKEMEHLKQQLRQAEKAKRRQKQEMFIAQKKTKLNRSEEAEAEPLKDSSVDKDQLGTVSETQARQQQPRAVKKVYSSLNITVEPLTKITDSRASAALDFKSRRLAKAPRESIKTAVISYQKKLNVRK